MFAEKDNSFFRLVSGCSPCTWETHRQSIIPIVGKHPHLVGYQCAISLLDVLPVSKETLDGSVVRAFSDGAVISKEVEVEQQANRVALVTGGTQGLGRSVAQHLLSQGWEVVVCGRRLPGAPVGAEGREAWARTADVRDAEDTERLVADVLARFGRLDLLVNNAGGSPLQHLAESSARLIERVVALNLLGPLYVCRAAFPALKAVGGSVVNIASVSGKRPSPGTTAYGAAKAGLISATESLAIEWGPDVRVNCIVVGLVEDPDQVEHYGGQSAMDEIASQLAMRRMVRGEDLGPIVSWLASPGAAFLSGAQIALHSGGEVPMHMVVNRLAQNGSPTSS